jgi:hypothetical protein
MSSEATEPRAPDAPIQPEPPKARIRPELVISLFSLALSIVAAGTNLFQARLQTEQQQTTVWPYLDCMATISGEGFSFAVSNKGVGPAIVVGERYRYQNKDYETMESLVKGIVGVQSFDYSLYETTPVKNHVLSPQERWLVFRISDPRIAELAISKADQVEIFITYQSVYGKRWVCRGAWTE